ncbi:MAG: hypothetical protein KC503_03410 [Myxococcales bacterium]|nr:hypothetical protein [Myxococcales bacterium]
MLSGAVGLPSRAEAKRKRRRPQPKRFDISKHVDYLRVYSDGKGHFFVVPDFVRAPHRHRTSVVFYGNGKVFYRQRVPGGSRNGPKFTYTIFDPRARYPINSYFSANDHEGFFQCSKRRTKVKELLGARRTRVLKRAKFYDVYWRRSVHALLRDDDGVYYYVDKLWVPFRIRGNPHGSDDRGFEVYSGLRGKLKRLRMKNIVNDSAGQIFITTKGKLKLIVGDKPAWYSRGKKTQLTSIEVKRSTLARVQIYMQLGVYRGERLEKPCDDL